MVEANGDQRRRCERALTALQNHGWTLAVAESLTGGMLSAAIVEVPGASTVYRGGATTYATDTKASVLGVDGDQLAATGPVSDEVAKQMAFGAARLFGADWAMSTTGVAGPGDSPDGKQGTVFVAVHGPSGQKVKCHHFRGGRQAVREQAVNAALDLLLECLP